MTRWLSGNLDIRHDFVSFELNRSIHRCHCPTNFPAALPFPSNCLSPTSHSLHWSFFDFDQGLSFGLASAVWPSPSKYCPPLLTLNIFCTSPRSGPGLGHELAPSDSDDSRQSMINCFDDPRIVLIACPRHGEWPRRLICSAREGAASIRIGERCLSLSFIIFISLCSAPGDVRSQLQNRYKTYHSSLCPSPEQAPSSRSVHSSTKP